MVARILCEAGTGHARQDVKLQEDATGEKCVVGLIKSTR